MYIDITYIYTIYICLSNIYTCNTYVIYRYNRYMYIKIHAYIHTCIHTHTHTYIYLYNATSVAVRGDDAIGKPSTN